MSQNCPLRRSNISVLIPALAIFLLLSGCAATVKKIESLDNPDLEVAAGKSVYLLSVNLKNKYKPGHQPQLQTIIIINNKTEEDPLWFTIPDTPAVVADRLLGLGFSKDSDDPAVGNDYFVHFSLEPGQYILQTLFSHSPSVTGTGTFHTPIFQVIEVREPGVFYLGHVEAVVRERSGNELRAGSVVPLLPQAIVGASGGAFDVEISDQWKRDGPAFGIKYPSLEGIRISKAVLPSVDWNRAQIYGENPNTVSSTDQTSMIEPKPDKDIEQLPSHDITTASIAEQPKVEPADSMNYESFSGTYISEITGVRLGQFLKDSKLLVKIVQNGDEITGKYGGKEGKLWGNIKGNTIKFEWFSKGGYDGKGKWTFNPESNEAVGTWSTTSKGNGKWNLKKVE